MTPAPTHRVSARLSAIAPSATLAVDAKAKALKAEGRPVIGFGGGAQAAGDVVKVDQFSAARRGIPGGTSGSS
ncbi:MAG: hypothetical protein ACFNS9_09115, partial [Actinomyces sp.]